MKALAIAMWLTAVVLLVCVLRMDERVTRYTDAVVPAERSLLAIAQPAAALLPMPALVEEPAPALDEAASVLEPPAPVAGCSRLGVFPRRDWAERVAIILTDAAIPLPMAAASPSRVIEEMPAKPWRIQRIGVDAYYLQFDAWGIDELASRMTLQRALLRKLLSITAIPEAC